MGFRCYCKQDCFPQSGTLGNAALRLREIRPEDLSTAGYIYKPSLEIVFSFKDLTASNYLLLTPRGDSQLLMKPLLKNLKLVANLYFNMLRLEMDSRQILMALSGT
jgi:hypothetical protein